MEEGAKRRLIGAAVIVILLIIFLPMLLVKEETVDSEQEMATLPQSDFDQGDDDSVLEPPVEPPVSTFPEYEDPMQEDPSRPREPPPPEFFETPATIKLGLIPESGLAQVEETPPATKPKPAPKAASTPRPKTSPATKPQPAPKAASAPEPAPAQPSTSAGPSSWVIQVASLREYARADALVQDLRVEGFSAYIQEARVKQKLWYRIRIGPELTRERIESMAASLRTKTGMRGQIQHYP